MLRQEKCWPHLGKDAGGETGLEKERNVELVLLPLMRLASGCTKAVAVVPHFWWQRTVDYCLRTSSLNISAVSQIICVYKTSDKAFVKERLALSVTVFKGTKRLLSRAMLQSMATPSYPQPVYSSFMGHWSIFVSCCCQFLAPRLYWIIEECISEPASWIYSLTDSLLTAVMKARPCTYKHTTQFRSHDLEYFRFKQDIQWGKKCRVGLNFVLHQSVG